MKYFLIKAPRNNEYSYENSLTVLSTLNAKRRNQPSILSKLINKNAAINNNSSISLNIISIDAKIHFILGASEESASAIQNSLTAQYKNADIVELKSIKDIGIDTKLVEELKVIELGYKNNYVFPINTIDDFSDIDPLSPFLSLISRAGSKDSTFWLQIIASSTSVSWATKALEHINTLQDTEGNSSNLQQAQANLIKNKIKYKGLEANIRFATNAPSYFDDFKLSFDIFSNSFGNSITQLQSKPRWFGLRRKENIKEAMLYGYPTYNKSIFNILELTTLWHIPNDSINIPNIVWGKNFMIEPPESLPVLSEMTDDKREDYTAFAKAFYKNKERVFGISHEDRLLHTYIVGKTGSGKSWMMNNIIIDDMRKGHGVGLIDPHGQAIQTVLNYVPKNRINDVIVFDPADPEYAYPLNLLDVPNKEQRDLMVSNIISIFYKLYSHSWGPRLEHILRNVLLTLVNTPNATFVDVLRILNDTQYRKKVVADLDDVHLIRFWNREFRSMSDIQRMDAVSPINNKVGQFVSSPFIRKVVAWPRSKINIEKSMNEGKIMLFNLSQGNIGEDNSSLLGSAIVTQIQMAAMNRAKMKEEEIKPFFLAVDEFQNFATPSFAKILSEARKYKLGLTLVNQFTSQIDKKIMDAVLGNVGTLTSFNVGANDATILTKEFGNDITNEDLITLAKYQMISRISINKRSSRPFTCYSLPLPTNTSENIEKILQQSRNNFGVKLKNELTKKEKRKPRSFTEENQTDKRVPESTKKSNRNNHKKKNQKSSKDNTDKHTRNDKDMNVNKLKHDSANNKQDSRSEEQDITQKQKEINENNAKKSDSESTDTKNVKSILPNEISLNNVKEKDIKI